MAAASAAGSSRARADRFGRSRRCRESGHVGSHARQPCGHRFGQRQRPAFPAAGQHEDVRGVERLAHVGHETQKPAFMPASDGPAPCVMYRSTLARSGPSPASTKRSSGALGPAVGQFDIAASSTSMPFWWFSRPTNRTAICRGAGPLLARRARRRGLGPGWGRTSPGPRRWE